MPIFWLCVPWSGNFADNLAKVFAKHGDDDRADELLWQIIEADPNSGNGLLWSMSMKQAREREEGYVVRLGDRCGAARSLVMHDSGCGRYDGPYTADLV